MTSACVEPLGSATAGVAAATREPSSLRNNMHLGWPGRAPGWHFSFLAARHTNRAPGMPPGNQDDSQLLDLCAVRPHPLSCSSARIQLKSSHCLHSSNVFWTFRDGALHARTTAAIMCAAAGLPVGPELILWLKVGKGTEQSGAVWPPALAPWPPWQLRTSLAPTGRAHVALRRARWPQSSTIPLHASADRVHAAHSHDPRPNHTALSGRPLWLKSAADTILGRARASLAPVAPTWRRGGATQAQKHHSTPCTCLPTPTHR